MILLAQLIVYLAALAGVVACSLGAMFFLGGALNRARDAGYRRTRALWTALCVCGIVASAGLGFVGVPAILYWAGS
ncbi:MAG TPA: hypothetical protein PLN53_08340 [Terricaulis sp.]|nr:hypothetical protein [Terricaulis sp.]